MLDMIMRAAIILSLIAGGAAAQTPGKTGTAAVDKNDPNRIICKRDDTPGTRLGPKKVCMSFRDWEERAQAGREHTERIQALRDQRN